MNRSRRSNRRYARSRSNSLLGRSAGSAASRLAHSAGSSVPATVEQLEQRQLLFSLTITPGMVDPNTGVGTATAIFGYVLPYLNITDQIQIQPDEVVIEDFADEPLPTIGSSVGAGGNVPDGTVFAQSNFLLNHNILPNSNIRLVADPGPQGQLQTDTARLLVRLSNGNNLSLRVAASPTQTNVLQTMRSLRIDIGAAGGSATGLNLQNTRVELRYRGQVVGSFTGTQLGLLNTTLPGTGVGTFLFSPTDPNIRVFDTIEFIAIGGPNDPFTMDNLTRVTPPGNFADLIDSRIFGASVSFTGPAGASARFLDLYGRDIVQTIELGRPGTASNFVIVDPGDDGVPDFNDGIGRIVLSGVNDRSALTMFGGTITSTTGTGFQFTIVDRLSGLAEAMGSANFGYFFDVDNGASGLPPGAGSVLIGSPFVRNNTNAAAYNPAGGYVGPAFNFINPDQGVFAVDGSNMGSVYIHGTVHGASRFNGFLDSYYAGYQPGSLLVRGDLGALYVASDFGAVHVDPDNVPPGTPVTPSSTGAQLNVGRTLGEAVVGGRVLGSVLVSGDINNPAVFKARDSFRYFERERPFGIPDGTQNPETVFINSLLASSNYLSTNKANADGNAFRIRGQQPIFGPTVLRNDTLMSAEWVGSIASAVQIYGNLGGGDTQVNSANDPSDVYAFASDGQQEIVVEVFATNPLGLHVRLLDHNGRTVGGLGLDLRTELLSLGRGDGLQSGQRLRVRPPAPGVYFLVLANGATGDRGIDTDYVATIGGMATTTLGSFRSAAAFGVDNPNIVPPPSLIVQGGSAGAIRVATAFTGGAGTEIDPIVTYNGVGETDERLELKSSTISIAQRLYSLMVGGDIEGANPILAAQVIVGSDLGSLVTGLSPVVGVGPNEGDIGNFDLRVGGRIAVVDIKGAIGIDQDAQDPNFSFIGPSTIRTGTLGGDGSIGIIRVGEHVAAGLFTLVTSPGSTVGAFLTSQDVLDETGAATGIYGGAGGITFNTGFGSDVRFVDFPRIDLSNSVNAQFPIIGGQFVELIDDAGGRVRIQITNLATGVTGGFVRVLPVDGSQGVAIAQIDADLTGGRNLIIDGQGLLNSSDVISIGRIRLTGADAGSNVRLMGNVQMDVWSITQTGGEAFNEISNITPGGDIVAIDVVGLTRLNITRGDLGRTRLVPWGPREIGPFLGIQRGASDQVGAPIGIVGPMAGDWNGSTYRPANNVVTAPGSAFLDDIGSPVDPYLNGLIVRTGALADVQVGGAIGDVITQGGNITNVVANFDRFTPLGEFHGIFGSIYAALDLVRVDVGDGVIQRANSPLSTTGLFAGDDIIDVVGLNAVLRSSITAGNLAPSTAPEEGIVRIAVTNGQVVDAYISSEQLDGFWFAFYGYGSEARAGLGNIVSLSGINSSILRSSIFAIDILTTRFTGGVWDATAMNALGNIGTISATSFRNSTLQGTDLEFFPNIIEGAGNLGTLTTGTAGTGGDIQDLTVDILGNVTGSISARNISRSTIDVDGTISMLSTGRDIRASQIVAGQLLNASALGSIRTSRFLISGPIVLLSAANEIFNSQIEVTGPDGRIDTITARTLISGSIAAAGPIGTVQVTQGDLNAAVRTTTVRGNVTLLSASRDLNVTTDISGNVTTLNAGRHIGRQGEVRTILVRGSVGALNAPTGQLYSDVQIGQALTGTAVIGAPIHKPGNSSLGRGSIVAFGPINTVRTLGDFGGRIISHTGGITLVSINDGSFLAGGLIAAYDGDIRNVVINRGHLLGDIHADYILWAINVNASEDGVFGDIGVNPALNPNTFYSATRNQLPPGVIANTPVQGPSITAGRNIGRITTSNGSVFETFIYAARAIGTFTFNGSVSNDPLTPGIGSTIAAGSSIFRVLVSGDLRDTAIVAGVRDLGADGQLGGLGANADTNQSGRVGTVDVDGNASNVIISAGLTPGADGLYNTGDDRVTPGLSFVRHVIIDGTVTNVSAFSDWPLVTTSPGMILGGTTAPLVDSRIFPGGVPAGATLLDPNGAPASFTTGAGEAFTVRFNANFFKARAYWDPAGNRVILVNTRDSSTLTVEATPPAGQPKVLTNFNIVSNDDASMGSIVVDANLVGDSNVVVDNNVVNLQFNNAGGNARIMAGGNFRTFTTGHFSGGTIDARFIRTMTFVGDYGLTTAFDEVRTDVLAAGTITIGGNNAGVINVDRDITAFNVNGAMTRGSFRSGSNVGSFRAGSLSESRISVRDSLGPVTIVGNVFNTAIQAGGDLGADTIPGGTGPFNTDRVSNGFITSVSVGGTFTRSSIVAGLLRGADGFFGTDDDSIAAGRSTIGSVTIVGQAFGSNFNTEQYRISTTGFLGPVTVAGQTPLPSGNFRVAGVSTAPLPIQVVDLDIRSVSRVWHARLQFNQAMDASTLGAALSIREVRNSGNTLIPLTLNVHYTIAYEAASSTAVVIFNRAVTDRNLPQAAGVPGPGVYRFDLNPDVLRAAVAQARLDGDRDGKSVAGDTYSQDAVVGDAGDKITPEVITTPGNVRVDFYGPVDLDVVLDNNRTPDGIPDVNTVFRVQGSLGDHPDHDPSEFQQGGDADVYKITLRAGQILRLGSTTGTALLVQPTLLSAAGIPLFGDSAAALQLPSDLGEITSLTFERNWLIKQTGTYYVVVDASFGFNAFIPGLVPNIAPVGGIVGDYAFNLEIFDDLDSGFAGDTDSGDGQNLVTAPAPISFAGPDLVFGTTDDLSSIVVGQFSFTLNVGPDGVPNTGDDVVSGTNGRGITSTRTDSNRITTRINSAIGPAGHIGVPGDRIAPDVDIFHLNNGQPLAPNTRFTVTVKLSELGADLGSRRQSTLASFNGAVQLGVFETTTATDVDDALLTFSPTSFISVGGTPNTTISADGPVSYGFDANGDFTFSFITPGRLGFSTPTPASYAIYLQGVFNTDYSLEIVQQGTGAVPRVRQNIFIETRGGSLSWLEAGGLTTTVDSFTGEALGFTGMINGIAVDQYILTNLVANLTAAYNALGADVVVSTNPAQFEFQPFSTVFLTSSIDPNHFFNDRNYGGTQRSDPFNTDRNDQAAVFVPSFATLGLTPSTADLDRFVQALTSTVGRRVGELMGLRVTADQFGGTPRDIMAANSPENLPAAGNVYRYLNSSRALSGPFSTLDDTQFFLGRQNSFSLLDKILAP